jgi:hypothetical protein
MFMHFRLAIKGLAFTSLLVAQPCLSAPDAGDKFYFGRWSAGGEAGISIVGDVKISANHIEWTGSRSSPPCKTTYTVLDQTFGTTKYPDEGWPRSAIENRVPYDSVKVRLGEAACRQGIAYMRFAMRRHDPSHLDLVPYDSSNKPRGWFGMYHLDQYVCAGRPVEIVNSLHRLPEEVQVLLGVGRTGSDGIVDNDAEINALDPNLPLRRFNWAAANSDCLFAIIERGGSHNRYEVNDFRHAPQEWILVSHGYSSTSPTLDAVMHGVK